MHENRHPFDRFTIGYLAEFTPLLETIAADARTCDIVDVMCMKKCSQLSLVQKNNHGSETSVSVGAITV